MTHDNLLFQNFVNKIYWMIWNVVRMRKAHNIFWNRSFLINRCRQINRTTFVAKIKLNISYLSTMLKLLAPEHWTIDNLCSFGTSCKRIHEIHKIFYLFWLCTWILFLGCNLCIGKMNLFIYDDKQLIVFCFWLLLFIL